jgi:hypothetical protein
MYCSNKCKQKHHYDRVKEQTNTYHSQTIRSYKRKVQLIDLLGGCCKICKYDKNISALEFHHRDPNGKESQLDMRTLSNRSMDYIMSEVQKCDLLCSNCHREFHNPETSLEEIRKIII